MNVQDAIDTYERIYHEASDYHPHRLKVSFRFYLPGGNVWKSI